MQNPNEGSPLPKQELFGENLPALFSNQFHVSVVGGMTRIVFGELIFGGGDHMFPRSVVVIPTDRAAELSSLIMRVIQIAAENAAKQQPTGPRSV
jgi:hypothetical protein